jgi:hypothetical protein
MDKLAGLSRECFGRGDLTDISGPPGLFKSVSGHRDRHPKVAIGRLQGMSRIVTAEIQMKRGGVP